MRDRSSAARYAASIILSYFLSLFIFLLISSIILLVTVFSSEYMINRVSGSGFSELALSDLRETYISHSMESGIPEDVMLSALEQRHIDGAIKADIMEAYSKGPGYDYDRYENEIYNILLTYATEHNYDETDVLREGLQHLAQICVSDFKTYVVSPMIGTVGGAAVQYKGFITAAVAVSAVLAVLTAVFIKTANRRVTGWVSGYAWALGASAIGCTMISAAAFGSGFAQRINVTPLSYGTLITEWVEGIAYGYVAALIPLYALLAVCIAVWVIRRRRRRRMSYFTD